MAPSDNRAVVIVGALAVATLSFVTLSWLGSKKKSKTKGWNPPATSPTSGSAAVERAAAAAAAVVVPEEFAGFASMPTPSSSRVFEAELGEVEGGSEEEEGGGGLALGSALHSREQKQQQGQQFGGAERVTLQDVSDNDSDNDSDNKEEEEAQAQTVTGPTDAPPASASTEETEEGKTDAEEQSEEELKAIFNSTVAQAKRNFKAQRFEKAAEHYTTALDLIDKIPDFEERRAALYNNRAAMYEKSNSLAPCLRDCAMCLTFDPGHKLARLRKARVFNQLGKKEEALTELCCHMLSDRDEQKRQMAMGRSPVYSPPPDLLDEIISELVSRQVKEVLQERAAKGDASKALDASGAPNKEPPLLPSNYSTYDVLRSFESHGDLVAEYGGKSLDALNKECEEAEAAAKEEEETGGDGRDKCRFFVALHERGLAHVARREYGEAVTDFTRAFGMGRWKTEEEEEEEERKEKEGAGEEEEEGLEEGEVLVEAADAIAATESDKKVEVEGEKKAEEEARGGSALMIGGGGDADTGLEGVDDVVQASLLAWYGTFLHLSQHTQDAFRVYKASCLLDGSVVDVWVKRAGVLMDMNDLEQAKEAFETAVSVAPKSGTCYMFRAELFGMGAEKARAAGDEERVEEQLGKQRRDLETCLELSPGHLPAIGRMFNMLVAAEEVQEATDLIEASIAKYPTSSDLLLQKADFDMRKAFSAGDSEQARQQMAVAFGGFDTAIAADPNNPTSYYTKAMCMVSNPTSYYTKAMCMGMQSPEQVEAFGALMQAAVDADPLFQPALMGLANYKMHTAQTMEEGREALAMYDAMLKYAREPDELVQILSPRIAGTAKIRAAENMGLTTLQ